MDIFDLSIDEFEKEVDELLKSISEDDLFNELISNGLIVDKYEIQSYYGNSLYQNTWVHTDRTSKLNKIANIFTHKKYIDSNLMEAA